MVKKGLPCSFFPIATIAIELFSHSSLCAKFTIETIEGFFIFKMNFYFFIETIIGSEFFPKEFLIEVPIGPVKIPPSVSRVMVLPEPKCRITNIETSWRKWSR
jgi:hypothetical protein